MPEQPFVNPFSTGGGGTRFELLVAVRFVVDMLLDKISGGIESGPVRAVKLQQRNMGFVVDDLVAYCEGAPEPTLALQIKHSIRFTQRDKEISDATRQCWLQFRADKFDAERDRVGIAFSEESNTQDARHHIPELLTWARTSGTASDFITKCSKSTTKSKYLKIFEKLLRLAANRPVADDEVWRFLRILVTLPYEFDHPGARDSVGLLNDLRQLVANRDTRAAANLGSVLFDVASAVAKSGGEISTASLKDRLPPEAQARLPAAAVARARSIGQRLREQVVRQLSCQKNSRKYIPDVFVESQQPKDVARAFCNPVLFIKKLPDLIRAIDLSYFNRILKRLEIPPVSVETTLALLPSELRDLPATCDSLVRFCDSQAKKFSKFGHGSKDRGEVLASLAPEAKTYQAREMSWQLPSGTLSRRFDEVRDFVERLKGGVLFFRSAAGQGKTNLVCNLAEVLLKYDVPCLFWTGKDMGRMAVHDLASGLLKPASTSAPTEDPIEGIRQLCDARRAPLTIILDAINEHPNIPGFAQALESTIESLLQHDFVRFVITCRTEYFQHRFSNLEHASFAGRLHFVDNPHQQMESVATDRMLQGYLRFFRIDATFSSEAQAKLKSDPFLLRVFCEAYGAVAGKEVQRLSYQPDIYKDRLFETYLERKFAELSQRRLEDGKTRLGAPQAYMQLLVKIVKAMIRSRRFDSVSISKLSTNDCAAAEDLLHEDVIIRKDIVVTAVHGIPDEVIAFPFDELRDYVIARHLVTLYKPGRAGSFLSKSREIVNANGTAAEGVARFLFYAAKRAPDGGLAAVLSKEPWFQEAFIDCIFGVEDALVSDADIDELRRRFFSEERAARQIMQLLLFRANPETSPRLNLAFLNRLLDELPDDRFITWILPLFDSSMAKHAWREAWFPIEQLAKHGQERVSHYLANGRPEVAQNIVRLLLHLVRIRGEEYTSPAAHVLVELATGPYRQIIVDVLGPYLTDTPSLVTISAWDLIGDIARATNNIDDEALERAITAWRHADATKERSVALNARLLDLFELAALDGRSLPADVQAAVREAGDRRYAELQELQSYL